MLDAIVPQVASSHRQKCTYCQVCHRKLVLFAILSVCCMCLCASKVLISTKTCRHMPVALARHVAMYLVYIRPLYYNFMTRLGRECNMSSVFIVNGAQWEPDACTAFFALALTRRGLNLSFSQYRHAVIALADEHGVCTFFTALYGARTFDDRTRCCFCHLLLTPFDAHPRFFQVCFLVDTFEGSFSFNCR